MKQRELFGRMAILKGYVNQSQVDQALQIQNSLKERGEKHKMIGIIMLEKGMIGSTELIHLLLELEIYEEVSSLHTPEE